MVKVNKAKDGQDVLRQDVAQDVVARLTAWPARISGRGRASWKIHQKTIPMGAALEATR
jgi:hypothetical protein